MPKAPPSSKISHLPKRIFAPRRKEPRPCKVHECYRRSEHPYQRYHTFDRKNRRGCALGSCVAPCRRFSSPSTQAPAPLPSQSRSRSSLPCGSGELEASRWGRRSATAHRSRPLPRRDRPPPRQSRPSPHGSRRPPPSGSAAVASISATAKWICGRRVGPSRRRCSIRHRAA